MAYTSFLSLLFLAFPLLRRVYADPYSVLKHGWCEKMVLLLFLYQSQTELFNRLLLFSRVHIAACQRKRKPCDRAKS